jgi:hypothetical protein
MYRLTALRAVIAAAWAGDMRLVAQCDGILYSNVTRKPVENFVAACLSVCCADLYGSPVCILYAD